MNLVFLHGVAASGKLTTGRELERELGYPVFHNHLVVDLLTTVFTFAPEATVSPGFPARVAAVVTRHGGAVCFVRLAVSAAEQQRRIADPARREFHKLSDVGALRRLQRLDAKGQPEQPPVDLEVDTDVSSARESARTIIDHFGLRLQERPQRYPAS